MSTIALPCLIAGLLAQAANTTKDADERLAFMRRTLEVYKVGPAAARGTVFRFQADPVLRFTNPLGTAPAQDGGIFFWLGEGDRPEAAVQIFYRRKSNTWMREFMSFSPEPLIADLGEDPPWAPTRGGVQFKAVPEAPTPAETPAQRLRQMRTGRRFYRRRRLPAQVLAAASPARKTSGPLWEAGHGRRRRRLLQLRARHRSRGRPDARGAARRERPRVAVCAGPDDDLSPQGLSQGAGNLEQALDGEAQQWARFTVPCPDVAGRELSAERRPNCKAR